MITRNKKGVTHITLGEGTCFSGIAKDCENDHPTGIAFTQSFDGLQQNDVVLHLNGMSGIASYLRPLFNYIELNLKEGSDEALKAIKDIQDSLAPHLPKYVASIDSDKIEPNPYSLTRRLSRGDVSLLLDSYNDDYSGNLVRHVKTGGVYRIDHFSLLNANGSSEIVVNYHLYDQAEQRDHNKVRYTRPASEFFDGRFSQED
ncbi:hypothetical protein ACQR3P_29105 [Rhodococcus sp. IEGM1300]